MGVLAPHHKSGALSSPPPAEYREDGETQLIEQWPDFKHDKVLFDHMFDVCTDFVGAVPLRLHLLDIVAQVGEHAYGIGRLDGLISWFGCSCPNTVWLLQTAGAATLCRLRFVDAFSKAHSVFSEDVRTAHAT